MTGQVPLLRIEDARVTFGRGGVQAVAGVDLEMRAGEVLAVVGESGSGKSTLARAVVGLQRLTSGRIEFATSQRGRGPVAQMVFQDPRASLNPTLTVRQIVQEAWRSRGSAATAQDRERVIADLLDQVGISPTMLDSRPPQLSGGQCQRVSIARALVVQPSLLVCDEVVSALDVSIQAQVLDVLRGLKESGLAMLFITHDLGVVRQLADRVAVMYLGKVVELGDADDVFERPTHPYTQALVGASVDLAGATSGARVTRLELRGSPPSPSPSPSQPPSGCRLHPRCWKARPTCAESEPALANRVGATASACHFAEPLDVLNGAADDR